MSVFVHWGFRYRDGLTARGDHFCSVQKAEAIGDCVARVGCSLGSSLDWNWAWAWSLYDDAATEVDRFLGPAKTESGEK